jgi:hypothetical protein
MTKICSLRVRLFLVAAAMAVVGLGLAVGSAGAGKAPATAPSAGGRDVYLKTRGTYPITTVWNRTHSWVVTQTEVVEQWITADGSGRQRTVVPAAARFASPHDREVWEDAGRPPFLAHGFHGHQSTEALPPGSFYADTYQPGAIAKLPHGTVALREWLEAQGEASGAGDSTDRAALAIEVLGRLLQNPYADRGDRLALERAAATIDGVRRMPPRAKGRPGLTLGAHSGRSGADRVYTVTYAPTDGTIIASQIHGVGESALASGGRTVYLDQGFSDPAG